MAVIVSKGIAVPEYRAYVPCLQTSGTQYIVTDIVPTPTTKMVLDCELTYTAGAYTKTAGAYGSNASFSWWTYGANLEAYYAGTSKSMTGPTGRVTLIADGNVWSAGGTDFTFTAASFTTDRPIWIGNIQDGGNYAPTPMKIYSCQIYNGGVLVCNLWPCYDPDGVLCMYDKVTKTYFYNAGTGEFGTEGSIVEPPILVTITGTGDKTYCCATIAGVVYSAAASNVAVRTGDVIALQTYSMISPHYIYVNGSTVSSTSATAYGKYNLTVTEAMTAITIDLRYSGGKGEIYVTTS